MLGSPRRRGRPGRDRRVSTCSLRRTSSGGPSAIFSPWSSTITVSASWVTTSSLCSISRMVSPVACRLLDLLGQLQRLGRVHAGGRLVEQQDARARGQRAGDLDPAAVGVGQPADGLGDARQQPVAEQADDVERAIAAPPPPPPVCAGVRSTAADRAGRAAARAGRSARSPAPSASGTGGCSGTCAPRRARAPRAAAARAARRRGSGSLPVGRHQAGDHVEQGGLAGAVRADHRHHAARRHGRGPPCSARSGRRTARSRRATSSARRVAGSQRGMRSQVWKPPRADLGVLLRPASAPACAASPGSAPRGGTASSRQDDAEEQLDPLHQVELLQPRRCRWPRPARAASRVICGRNQVCSSCSSTAPSTTPQTLPMPPSTTMTSIIELTGS